MNMVNGLKRNLKAPYLHLRILRRKLAKIEREFAEAEELKSLKPAEMMEAFSKRKVEMENQGVVREIPLVHIFGWFLGCCRQRHS